METLSYRLKMARTIRNTTMEQLVSRLDNAVTKQAISKYELGKMRPKKDVLCMIAKALQVPLAFFDQPKLEIGGLWFRDPFSPMDDNQRKTLIHNIEKLIDEYCSMEKLLDIKKVFVNPLKEFRMQHESDYEIAADILRMRWQLGMGSLTTITRILERKGILVLMCDLGQVDGFSLWTEGNVPVILISNNLNFPIERRRFTLCHELGHLLLPIPDTMDAERVCNRFAGAFLLPQTLCREEVGDYCERLYLQDLIDLKNAYGVSVSAWVHRLYDLAIIDRSCYDDFYNNVISQNRKEIGWGHYVMDECVCRFDMLKRHLDMGQDKKEGTSCPVPAVAVVQRL